MAASYNIVPDDFSRVLNGSEFRLKVGKKYTMGASYPNHVLLRGASIAGRHAELSVYQEGIWIRDTGTCRETRIGTETLHGNGALIREGDRFRIGPLWWEVRKSQTAQEPDPFDFERALLHARNGHWRRGWTDKEGRAIAGMLGKEGAVFWTTVFLNRVASESPFVSANRALQDPRLESGYSEKEFEAAMIEKRLEYVALYLAHELFGFQTAQRFASSWRVWPRYLFVEKELPALETLQKKNTQQQQKSIPRLAEIRLPVWFGLITRFETEDSRGAKRLANGWRKHPEKTKAILKAVDSKWFASHRSLFPKEAKAFRDGFEKSEPVAQTRGTDWRRLLTSVKPYGDRSDIISDMPRLRFRDGREMQQLEQQRLLNIFRLEKTHIALHGLKSAITRSSAFRFWKWLDAQSESHMGLARFVAAPYLLKPEDFSEFREFRKRSYREGFFAGLLALQEPSAPFHLWNQVRKMWPYKEPGFDRECVDTTRLLSMMPYLQATRTDVGEELLSDLLRHTYNIGYQWSVESWRTFEGSPVLQEIAPLLVWVGKRGKSKRLFRSDDGVLDVDFMEVDLSEFDTIELAHPIEIPGEWDDHFASFEIEAGPQFDEIVSISIPERLFRPLFRFPWVNNGDGTSTCDFGTRGTVTFQYRGRSSRSLFQYRDAEGNPIVDRMLQYLAESELTQVARPIQ